MYIRNNRGIPFFFPLVISSTNRTSILTSAKRFLALTFLLCCYLLDISTLMTHRRLKFNICRLITISIRRALLLTLVSVTVSNPYMVLYSFLNELMNEFIILPFSKPSQIKTSESSLTLLFCTAIVLPRLEILPLQYSSHHSCLLLLISPHPLSFLPKSEISFSYPISRFSFKLHIGLCQVLFLSSLPIIYFSASTSISMIAKCFSSPLLIFLVPHFLLSTLLLDPKVSIGPST